MGATRAHSVLLAAAVWLAVAGSHSAIAQDWPSKPVKIVVAFAPGGTADFFARLLAPELSKIFKQQFYVENRAGNSGATGSAFVARAEPDGYTLLIGGSGPHLTAPAINPNVGYDPLKDFTHLAMIGGDTYVLVAHPDLRLRSLAELVTWARQNPATCASPGSGSLGHLIQEQFRLRAEIKLQHVPFRGAGEAMSSLLGNHVSLAMLPVVSTGEHIRAGKLVPIAVTATERHPAFADVPTFAELGYPEVRGTTWFWLAGPKNLPPEIAGKLALELRRVVQDPAIKQRFAADAILTQDTDAAGLNRFLAEEVAFWGEVARNLGIKVQ
jgi:tripartite-type tricarboxylate transporter receptor subunit TctC